MNDAYLVLALDHLESDEQDDYNPACVALPFTAEMFVNLCQIMTVARNTNGRFLGFKNITFEIREGFCLDENPVTSLPSEMKIESVFGKINATLCSIGEDVQRHRAHIYVEATEKAIGIKTTSWVTGGVGYTVAFSPFDLDSLMSEIDARDHKESGVPMTLSDVRRGLQEVFENGVMEGLSAKDINNEMRLLLELDPE